MLVDSEMPETRYFMQGLIGSHISHRTDISSHWLETIIEKIRKQQYFFCVSCAHLFFKEDHSCSSHIFPNEPNCAGFGLTCKEVLSGPEGYSYCHGNCRHISPRLATARKALLSSYFKI